MEEKAVVSGAVLRDKLNAYMIKNRLNITDVARGITYSRTTVSRYLAGKYESDATDIENRIRIFLGDAIDDETLTTEEITKASRRGRVGSKAFFESRDAVSILGVCQSSQEYHGLGIVVGRSGYGKTHTLKEYAKLPKVAYIECDDTMGINDLAEAIERALGLPRGYGTIWKRTNNIRAFCNVNKGYLIIIDEADKLISKHTQKKMELIRGIFDQADVGIVIAGEPQLEIQIKNYLARLANRMDFYTSLKGISPSEVEEFLSGYDIDSNALLELKARACNPQTGCFRLLDRTLSNIIRILKNEDSHTISLKIIEQASSMMML